MRKLIATSLICAALAATGCGTGSVTDFPHRLVGADGQEFVLEDLEEIANHATLTSEQKRERFRDLGIEDEDLIDALLGL